MIILLKIDVGGDSLPQEKASHAKRDDGKYLKIVLASMLADTIFKYLPANKSAEADLLT